MIPAIREIGFGPGTEKPYATLSNATVTLAEMGDRFISTQVKIDGDVVPDFDGWELEFRGERFVLNIKEPQAVKDNSTRNSIIDLTFYSWPILQLKRYFIFETTQTAAGTVMASKYNASVSLNVSDFCDLLNRVFSYYFGGKIYVDFNTALSSGEVAIVEMNYTYIWDVVQKLYEMYGVRWRIAYDEDTETYALRVGYDQPAIDDHDFEYGYEGGLLRFERQVQDADIKNILLGRGGTQNVPYLYFKDYEKFHPQSEHYSNKGFAPDPDAIPELENIYFDRIYDANFRNYVQGWRTNENCALAVKDPYDAARGSYDWAYQKGHTDESFDPVEYVKDDVSIAKYGEKWGALEDNDEIYPTIQGVVRGGGRIDTVLAVSPITTDEIGQASSNAARKISIEGVKTQADLVPGNTIVTKRIQGSRFTVPEGMIADVLNNGFFASAEYANRASQARLSVVTDMCSVDIYDDTTGNLVNPQGLTEGDYFYAVTVAIRNVGSAAVDNVTYGVNGLYLQQTNAGSGDEWKPTFDIYVRNLFDSQQGTNETDEDYALRVWQEILGDHLGNEAKVVFSDGFMSISEDYEFTIASYPVVDRSKTLNGFQSEWRISLYKSDAEFDATGYFIPNAKDSGSPIAGDHFFFIGIDMPHFYVTEAEKRLNEYKTAALDDTAEVNPTWVVSLDKVRMDEEYNESQERLFEKMDSGVEMHVRDRRFAPRMLTLYASSVTFTWQDGTVILPDVEVVLTDKPIVVQSQVQTIQNDIDILKSAVAQATNVENVVKQLTRPMYLSKAGEEQTSLSPTKFASLLTSEDFQQGELGGRGWGLYRDNHVEYQEETIGESDVDPMPESDGEEAEEEQSQPAAPQTALPSASRSVFEVDKLVVRHEMHVNNIVVNQIAYVGGKQIISAAAMECVQVVEQSDGYDCYFDQKQGSVKNLFRVGDIAMGQIFSADNIQLRFYKRVVTAVGQDYIRLSKTMKYGDGVPRKGDVIVQFGNVDNPDRQYAIIRDVIGGGYEQMLSDLDTVYNDGVEYYFAGISSNQYGDSIPLMTNQGENLMESRDLELHVHDVAKPRFFIGDPDSHILYSAKDKTIYQKGNIVQSPAGVEFPVPCFRSDGPYSASKWYYYGDMVVYNGASWIHIGKNATMGTTPSDGNIWRLYAAKGDSIYRLDLTNDNASINADASGAILPGAVRPTCTATMYLGSAVVNDAVYSITTPQASAATGVSINQNTGVITFGSNFSFTGTSLAITVQAVSGSNTVVSIMNVTKSLPGVDGQPAVSYWLELSADKVSVDPNAATPAAVPATITARAWLQVGAETPREAVAGDGLTIKYKFDDGSYANYPSGGITVDITKKTLYITLYKGTSIVDGAEAVPILYEGLNGQDGESAVFADIDNEMDGVVVNPDGTIASTITTHTTVSMWLGTQRQELQSITFGQEKPSYVVATLGRDGNNKLTGAITFTISDTTQVLPTSIAIPITVTCRIGNLDVPRDLTYTLAAIRGAEPGVNYKLIPSVSAVTKDPNDGTYSTPAVFCDKKKVKEGESQSATDCVIYYKRDADAAETEYSSLGVPTTGLTDKIIFFLYLNTNPRVLVDQETVPLVYDGLNGQGLPGANGKSMRGISVWNNGGYLGSEPYQGKNDQASEYYDIVIDSNNEQFYQCLYAVYPEDQTITATSIRPSGNNPCWELMNNYENIATKALAATQALIDQLTSNNAFIESLKVNTLSTENDEIQISKGTMTGVSNGDTKFNIHTGSLNGSKSNDTKAITSPHQTTTDPGDAQAEITLLTGIQIADGYGNNRVAIPAATLSASCSVSPDATPSEWTVIRYLTNGTTRMQAGSPVTFSGSSVSAQTIPAVTFNNLPVGTWSLLYIIAPDLTADTQTITASLATSANLVVSYPQPSGAEMAGDGFRAVYGGTTSTQQGIIITADGAKVVQDGTAKNMLGSSTGRGFEFVAAGDSYPSDSDMLEGVLYIKLGQATS